MQLLAEIHILTIEKFNAEDEDCPDYRIVRAKERAIYKCLGKITEDKNEQRRILDAIERANLDMENWTYNPVFANVNELGYKIIDKDGREYVYKRKNV